MALKIGVAGVRRGSGPAKVLQLHRDCELTAVCDLNTERAKAFAEQNDVPHWYDDYEAFVASDLDAIVVATPAPVHVECVEKAMRAGKHALSEVPACWTLDEARRLVTVVRETGLKYMFAENMCYFAYCQSYGEMIRRGDVGEVVYIEGEYVHNCESLMTEVGPDGETRLTWRTKLPPIQYCTHELGPILQWLPGERIVSAVGLHSGNRRRPDLGVIDLEVALFRTTNGALIKLLCTFSVAKEPAHHWFTIYGTQGHLEGPRWGGEHYLQTPSLPYNTGHAKLALAVNHPGAPAEATVGGHGTSEYYMCNDFVRSILDDTTPAIDVYAGLDMTLPGICAHLSADQGGTAIPVPDPREF